MSDEAQDDHDDHPRILLPLLTSVARDGEQSQRQLAKDLGVALGLVNAYVKRCVRKGLVKVRQAPAKRYVYYLTPQGFAEKSRLTLEYLSVSLGFFRQARDECSALLLEARAAGCRSIALAGRSELAEIVAVCTLDCGIEIVGTVDAGADKRHYLGRPVFQSFDELIRRCGEPDAVMITDLATTFATHSRTAERFGAGRTMVPPLISMSLGDNQQGPQ